MPPTSGAERGNSKKFKNIANPSKPNIMEGTAAKLFIFTSTPLDLPLFFGANSSKYIAVAIPIGKDSTKVILSAKSDPTKCA